MWTLNAELGSRAFVSKAVGSPARCLSREGARSKAGVGFGMRTRKGWKR